MRKNGQNPVLFKPVADLGNGAFVVEGAWEQARRSTSPPEKIFDDMVENSDTGAIK
jgi:hypothetical protein